MDDATPDKVYDAARYRRAGRGKVFDSILDTIGCCVFGVTLPWTAMLIDLVREEGGNPQARVIGTGLKTSVSQAVLIGATAGHGFEMDDIHAAAHLHAGSLALPTALALAEAHPTIDGRALLAAIAAGYEVGLRVSLAATGKLFMPVHHFSPPPGARRQPTSSCPTGPHAGTGSFGAG